MRGEERSRARALPNAAHERVIGERVAASIVDTCNQPPTSTSVPRGSCSSEAAVVARVPQPPRRGTINAIAAGGSQSLRHARLEAPFVLLDDTLAS